MRKKFSTKAYVRLTLEEHQTNPDVSALPTPRSKTVSISHQMQFDPTGDTAVLQSGMTLLVLFLAEGNFRSDLNPFLNHSLICLG